MNKANKHDTRFVFFGGEPLGVPALEALAATGLIPSLVVCNPDRPTGRKQTLTPPPVKVWAEARNIPVAQPTSYKDEDMKTLLNQTKWDVFVVVAYNFILPDWLLELPGHGAVNLHPSLLPKYRGASPIRSALLNDDRENIGVSVMLLDEQMDHGPIIAQASVTIPDTEWPISGRALDVILSEKGGSLLADTLPSYVAGEINPQPQDHTQATYCGKLTKSDGELAIDPHHLPADEEAYRTLLKIRGLDGFPGTYFFHRGKRVKILSARMENNSLIIERVIPEGRGEQAFPEYLQTLNK